MGWVGYLVIRVLGLYCFKGPFGLVNETRTKIVNIANFKDLL